MTMTVTGACLLWVGWFGFNAGSALAADGAAGMAMLVTHIGAATGSLAWLLCEWLRYGKPSVLGIVTGMVAGLGTITPASGFVGPMGAIAIGATAGIVCFFATSWMKRSLRIDDSLDVTPVHGVGGVIGTLLTGVFVASASGGVGYPDNVTMGEPGRWCRSPASSPSAHGPASSPGCCSSSATRWSACASGRMRKPRAWTPCEHNEKGYDL